MLSKLLALGLLLLSGMTPAASLPGVDVGSEGARWPTADASGRLAYLGGDGNVYVTALRSGAPVEATALTTDATVSPEGRGRSYHRLVWSNDGSLAYAAVERGAGETRSELHVRSAAGQTNQVSAHEGSHVIYMHWSPASCAGCAALTYLIEGETAIDLRRIDGDPAMPENRIVASGRPFYFSWSPDGRTMLWHRGGAQRFNPGAALTQYDLTTGRSADLDLAPGSHLAPAFSPDGRSWLAVGERNGRNALVVSAGATRRVIASGAAEYAFAWSPDGAHIAYAGRSAADAPAYGPIQLYSLADGATTQITQRGFHPRAFFWSPDGSRLAYINWLAIPEAHWSQWRVYDVAAGTERGYAAFNPSPQMRMVMGSFNQYGQSHRLWSADGRYLLYADRDRELIERIWLVDTVASSNIASVFVAEGSFGVWAP